MCDLFSKSHVPSAPQNYLYLTGMVERNYKCGAGILEIKIQNFVCFSSQQVF